MPCNANEDAPPVRCSECGWCGHADELGTEADAFEEWGADTLWRLSEVGDAVKSAAKAARGEG